ncbi:hypothetical protein G6672_09235 [Polynucleobacter paneuropaeus]|jgi:hypothetical protein|nr:hypothetical protein [Polynucleobacter paneuropaeus]
MKLSLNSLPSMDPEGLECFKRCISKSNVYMEFGSGGSTMLALNTESVKAIISVDSDKTWVNSVKEVVKVAPANPSKRIYMEHADIGPVGDWGVPINHDHFKSYHQYMSLPWMVAKREQLIPDLILVDGRFRIASFLFSLVNARSGTTILFDDYFDRPEYFLVEDFCKLQSRRGRMGAFEVGKIIPSSELALAIGKYSVISG